MSAEKKYGIAAGSFSLRKICHLPAPKVVIRSIMSVFTARKPSNTVITMGKNVISTVTSTLLQIVYPNQSTNSGASAVVGIVCEATMSG